MLTFWPGTSLPGIFKCRSEAGGVDSRNELVERYPELVDVIRPRIVLMENVLGITYDFKVNGEKSGKPAPNFADKLKLRLGENYNVVCSTLRACEFGVPQSRPRFFLLAVLKTEARALGTQSFFQAAPRSAG